MPSQAGYFDTLKSAAGKIFTFLSTITLTGTDGKTVTVTADTSLDEAGAMSSKATQAKDVFTPVLKFGGGTTGITYTTQTGRYVRTGNVLHFVIYIALSSKGTAVGAATITGLPFVNVAIDSLYFAQGDYVTTLFTAFQSSSTQILSLFTLATSAAVLTDANFANDSIVRISGFYEIP